MKKLRLFLASSASLLLILPVQAEQEHRQLGAHMHGQGALSVAIESKKVAMELVIPGMDIVGFEHKPSTDEQKLQVKTAIEFLEKEPSQLFTFSKEAKCTFLKASAKLGEEIHRDRDDHDEAGKKAHDDDHEDDHDHGKADKKAHDDDHDKDDDHVAHTDHDEHEKEKAHSGEERHNEFRATYELECAAPKSFKEIQMPFFKRFPRSEQLTVTIAGDHGASSHKATRDKPQVTLGVE